MIKLSIDIETYSTVNLKDSGVYKYSEDPQFQILLFAFHIDNLFEIIDLTKQFLPKEIITMIKDPKVVKTAWNALFERVCLEKYLGPLDPKQWNCTMVKSLIKGYPASLDSAAKAIGSPIEKDKQGNALIKHFCVPNKFHKQNKSTDFPEKWEQFKDYCLNDVKTERAIDKKLGYLDMSSFGFEADMWILDQKINDLGVMVDKNFVKNCIQIDNQSRDILVKDASYITDLQNPNSVKQLVEWLNKELPEDYVENLTKESVSDLLKSQSLPDHVKNILEIRQKMSKSSIKKYHAIIKGICEDERIHGSTQYYGANRTGRWAGRLVQVHNLRRTSMKLLDKARRLAAKGDIDSLDLLFPSIQEVLSQLVRTSFIPAPGHKFIISDFSAIEARVVAWLAGERWRLDIFKSHGKIYEASGAKMFNVPIEQVTKGSVLRDKAKIAELALGYQGSVGALLRMGAIEMGIKEDELDLLVKQWRAANRSIVRYWYNVNKGSIDALKGNPMTCGKINFIMRGNALAMHLPSGRSLYYVNPKLGVNAYGQESFAYMGLDQTTKQWVRIDTYGGKLVENMTQAIARDCLGEAMLRIDKNGYKIVMHVHDEVVIEVPEESAESDLKKINELMAISPDWAKDLPLKGDSYISDYYKKD